MLWPSTERIETLNKELHLPDLGSLVGSELTEGRKQLVAIAVSLLHSPRLLVLEGPFRNSHRVFKLRLLFLHSTEVNAPQKNVVQAF